MRLLFSMAKDQPALTTRFSRIGNIWIAPDQIFTIIYKKIPSIPRCFIYKSEWTRVMMNLSLADRKTNANARSGYPDDK